MPDFTPIITSRPRGVRLAGVFRVAALLLLLAAIVLAARQYRFLEGSASIQGTVVQLLSTERSQSTGNGGTRKTTLYRPEVAFKIPDGAIIHFFAGSAVESPQLQVGQPVTVRYRTDNPGQAQIDRFVDQWQPALLCAIAAVAAGVISWRLRKR